MILSSSIVRLLFELSQKAHFSPETECVGFLCVTNLLDCYLKFEAWHTGKYHCSALRQSHFILVADDGIVERVFFS